MQNVKIKFLVAFLLVIISVVVIVLAGIMGLGKKIGAPGLDNLVARGVERFLEHGKTGPFPETTLPGDMDKIVGTWSGVSDIDNTKWKFSFEQNYAVRMSNSKGYYRQGTAFIHWKLGLTDGYVRVPPGWSVLDLDIIQSSEPSHRNSISLGAFSLQGKHLKYCFCEPGKMVRPVTDESREGILCFELTKDEAGSDVSIVPQASVPVPAEALPGSAPQTSSGMSPPAQESERFIRVKNFYN